MSFKPGDKVSYNGGIIAEVVSYNPSTDRLILKTTVGGAENTIHEHISRATLELLESAEDGFQEPVISEGEDGTLIEAAPEPAAVKPTAKKADSE